MRRRHELGRYLRRAKRDHILPLPVFGSALVPVKWSRGAILVWAFDESEEGQPFLMLELTSREALQVVRTDVSTTGLIENIRKDLRDRIGVVVGYGTGVTPFKVRADWTERQFMDEMLTAASDPTAYREKLVSDLRLPRAVRLSTIAEAVPMAAAVREASFDAEHALA